GSCAARARGVDRVARRGVHAEPGIARETAGEASAEPSRRAAEPAAQAASQAAADRAAAAQQLGLRGGGQEKAARRGEGEDSQSIPHLACSTSAMTIAPPESPNVSQAKLHPSGG